MRARMRTISLGLFMLMAKIDSQMKAPQTKRKQKTKPMPAENPLGCLGRLTARNGGSDLDRTR
jgi:hypothetical protein